MNLKNPIVVFEGIDGAGKSTVARLVADKVFRETETNWMPRVVHPLHDSDVSLDLYDRSYKTYLLSLAAHADVWQNIIEPRYQEQLTTFLDRGVLSVAVYHKKSLGDVLINYSYFNIGKDYTTYVYLDVKPETAYQRLTKRGALGVNESLDELQQAYTNYEYALDNAKFRWKDRVIRIDANGSLESVVQAVFDAITE